MERPTAFTCSYNGKVNMIISSCHVCPGFNPETYKGTPPPLKEYKALWDTGATSSVITRRVVEQLGLKPVSITNVHTASGCEQAFVYLVNIRLPQGVGFHSLPVTEAKLNGFDVLIGMDIIGMGDFTISKDNDKTLFSFQCPSTHSTDYVKELEHMPLPKQTPVVNPHKVGRNELCPCGSRKKFKKCCGKP